MARALETMSGVMSTPMTVPLAPTWRAARKASKPAPLPRSSTVSPGLQRGDGLRVAAAQAEVGALRHRSRLLGAVADAARQQFGDILIRRRAASRARRTAAAGFGARHGAVGGAHLLADLVVFVAGHDRPPYRLQQQDLPEGVGVQQAPPSATAMLASGSAGCAQWAA